MLKTSVMHVQKGIFQLQSKLLTREASDDDSVVFVQIDPMERFGSKQRLLSLDLDIPVELLQNAGPPENSTDELKRTEVVGHLKLVQYQAAQVRQG